MTLFTYLKIKVLKMRVSEKKQKFSKKIGSASKETWYC